MKIAGNRINLNEIEYLLKTHFHCQQPIVRLINSKIVVFFKENDRAMDFDRHILSKYLPSYAIPSSFISVPDFPLLVSGKIDREQLTRLGHAQLSQPNNCPMMINALTRAFEEFGIERSNLDQDFFSAGGSSLNAILIVNRLHQAGFRHLTVERLLQAPRLRDILMDFVSNQINEHFQADLQQSFQVNFRPLEQVNKDMALKILGESFIIHGEIDALIHQNQENLQQEYASQWTDVMKANWEIYLKSNLSFGAMDENDQLIGVALSYDMNHPPASSNQQTILTPLNTIIDSPLFDRVNQLRSEENLTRIMRNHVTTVDPNLTPGQRLTTMYQIEKQLLELAKSNNYQAVITANTSSVTQQLAEHVFKYDTHQVTDVSEFIDPSTSERLFPDAPPHYKVTISVKYLSS